MASDQFMLQLTNLCLHSLATLSLTRLSAFSLAWQTRSFMIWLPFQMHPHLLPYICNLHWSSLSYLKCHLSRQALASFLNFLSCVLELPSPPRPCKTHSTRLHVIVDFPNMFLPLWQSINLLYVHQYVEGFDMAHTSGSAAYVYFFLYQTQGQEMCFV